MRVLVACEFSSRVRDAFLERRHDAWSCDLLPSETGQGDARHYQCDVHRLLDDHWDLMIAFPPCTYLCNSGVRWLAPKGETDKVRWAQMEKAAQFFRLLAHSPIKKIAVENPIMHGFATGLIGRKHDQLIQPWQFGHGETKATCLWLKGLKKLVPTDLVDGRENRVHRMGPGPDRAKNRSITYAGIATAMAAQWT